jgi:hypothetical protein
VRWCCIQKPCLYSGPRTVSAGHRSCHSSPAPTRFHADGYKILKTHESAIPADHVTVAVRARSLGCVSNLCSKFEQGQNCETHESAIPANHVMVVAVRARLAGAAVRAPLPQTLGRPARAVKRGLIVEVAREAFLPIAAQRVHLARLAQRTGVTAHSRARFAEIRGGTALRSQEVATVRTCDWDRGAGN